MPLVADETVSIVSRPADRDSIIPKASDIAFYFVHWRGPSGHQERPWLRGAFQGLHCFGCSTMARWDFTWGVVLSKSFKHVWRDVASPRAGFRSRTRLHWQVACWEGRFLFLRDLQLRTHKVHPEPQLFQFLEGLGPSALNWGMPPDSRFSDLAGAEAFPLQGLCLKNWGGKRLINGRILCWKMRTVPSLRDGYLSHDFISYHSRK